MDGWARMVRRGALSLGSSLSFSLSLLRQSHGANPCYLAETPNKVPRDDVLVNLLRGTQIMHAGAFRIFSRRSLPLSLRAATP
jgi:hypothetical protein